MDDDSIPVAQVDELQRKFGKQVAIDGISFSILPARVYGLVGANGAGKTTLIKHLLGLLRAQRGNVQVFGLDPVREPAAVLSRIGYLSEQRELPEWMRIDELLRYSAAFHPSWDDEYADELMRMFRLDPSKKIKELSKGMRAQAGLIVAVAHRPEFLILDEPSTGLDAIVRQDILNAIIRTVVDDGRTVLFSSHLLDEVERMSDEVLMIDQGRIIVQGSIDEVGLVHHRMQVQFHDIAVDPCQIEGVLSASQIGEVWSMVTAGPRGQIETVLSECGGELIEARPASLQEIFVARVAVRSTNEFAAAEGS